MAGEPETKGGESELKPVSFSQEDLNRIVGQRVAEERGKFGDYEALKARAARADELELAQMTAEERQQVRIAELERDKADADERIATTAINSAIEVRAMRMGVVDPDAARALVDRTNIRHSDEKGVEGVDEALAALLTAKPYLKGPAYAPATNPGGEPAPMAAPLTTEERATARKYGMTDEEYGKYKRH